MPKLIIGALIILLIIGAAVAQIPQLKDTLLQKLPLASHVQNQIHQAKIDPEVQKKQDLEKFYNEISTAQNKQDWSKLYDLAPQSVKNNVTRDKYVAAISADFKKDENMSQQTIINSIQISGDTGTVDRTIITCYTKVYSLSQKKLIDTPDCTGESRKEDNAKRKYVYINGKWQIPDPEPSERGLKAANYGYENSSKSDQKDLRARFSYGSDSPTFTVRNWAVFLDGNLEELIRVETLVEQDKSEKSRPVYNQQPAQIIQQPAPVINNPAPVIQQQTYPRNCTSSTLGSYTYTNCY